MSLDGRTILITRPKGQNDGLRAALEARGATVLEQPAIQIRRTGRPDELDAALRALASTPGGWVLFSSANGVAHTLDAAQNLFGGAAETVAAFLKGGVKIAVVGGATKRAVEAYGLSVDVEPETEFNAEGLVAALDASALDFRASTFFSFRGNRGRDVLKRELSTRGADYCETVAYETSDVEVPDAEVLRALQGGLIDATVATSSGSAAALARVFGYAAHKTRWVAISPLTGAALTKLGLDVATVALEASDAGLVEALEASFR